MDLTADNLVEALTVCSGGAADGPAEIAALAREAQPAFAATLFSAWQAEGMELNPALRYEVDSVRARAEYYRSVTARLMAEVGSGLTTVKGLEVAALYPQGLVRYMSDVDFIAQEESGLWLAASLLMQDGWDLDTATFSHLEGRLHVVVSLRREPEDRYELPYGIELATYYTLGDQGSIPPIIQLPGPWHAPAIKNTVMLLHERYEQPFRAKDLVDAALLHDSLRHGEITLLHDAVVTLGLALEYSELARLVGRAGLGPLAPLPGGPWTTARERARRIARGASFFARPVAGTGHHLQRRDMMGKTSRAEGVIWTGVQRRLSVTAAIKAGLLAYGLPLEGPRPETDVAVLRERDGMTWADTPVGRFLLTIGHEVSEAAVEELSGPGDASQPGSEEAAGMSR